MSQSSHHQNDPSNSEQKQQLTTSENNLSLIALGQYVFGSLARGLQPTPEELFERNIARMRIEYGLARVRDAIDRIITELQNAPDFPGKIEIMKRLIIGFLDKYGKQILLDIGYLIVGVSPKTMEEVVEKVFGDGKLQPQLRNLISQNQYEGSVLCPEQVIFSLPLVRYTESNRNVRITTIEQVLNNIGYTRSDISRGQTPDLITLFKQIISAYEVINHFISSQPENQVEDEKNRREFQITHNMLIRACRRKIGEFWGEVYSLVKFLIFDPSLQKKTDLQSRISQVNDEIVAKFDGLTIKIVPNYPPVVEITFDGETPITLTDPLKL